MEEVLSDDIISFIHCTECVKELPEDISPAEYVNIEIGINIDNQILLGCVRHGLHVGAFTLKEDLSTAALKRGCDCCE